MRAVTKNFFFLPRCRPLRSIRDSSEIHHEITDILETAEFGFDQISEIAVLLHS